MEVIDSLYIQLPLKAVKQVVALVHKNTKELQFKLLNTPRQQGSSKCSLFAIATHTPICAGRDPCAQVFN